MAIFVDVDDLKNRIGSERVVQLLDDDGDGVEDTAPRDLVIARGNAAVEARLYAKGFTADDLTALSGDPLIRELATEVTLGYLGERRPEWLNANGEGPFDALRKRALAELADVARTVLRIPSEATTGRKTKRVGGSLSTADPVFTFAKSGADKRNGSSGPGGF